MMKKLFAVVLIVLVCCGIYAAEEQAPQQKSAAEGKAAQQKSVVWDFFVCTFVPGIPAPEDVEDVYGLKIGCPIGLGKNTVNGIELSILVSQTEHICGLQSAVLYNEAVNVDGIQAAFIYNYAKKVSGLQFSLINVAEDTAFQIGFLNFIRNSPLYCFPFFNCCF